MPRLALVVMSLVSVTPLVAQAEGVRASGLVIDAHGRPVVAAEVVVEVAGKQVGATRTDALGAFSVRVPAMRPSQIRARSEDGVGNGEVDPRDLDTGGLRIPLRPCADAAGRVVDGGGPRAVGVRDAVVVFRNDLQRTDPPIGVETDENGRFACPRLPMGRYLVQVLADDRAPGFALWSHPSPDPPVFRIGEPEKSHDIRLAWPPAGGGDDARVDVRVTLVGTSGATPTALPPAVLHAVDAGLELRGVPQSMRVTLRTRCSTGAVMPIETVIPPRVAPQRLDFQWHAGRPVQMRASVEGVGVDPEGQRVWAQIENRRVPLDVAGGTLEFDLPGPFPLEVRLRAEDPTLAIQPPSGAARQQIRMLCEGVHPPPIAFSLVRGCEFSGRVLGPDDQPLGDARVVVSAKQVLASVATDRQGRFVLSRVPCDSRWMRWTVCDPRGTVSGLVDTSELSGQRVDLGAIRLVAGVDAVGVVLGRDGKPVPGCPVVLSRGLGCDWRGYTDAEGRFTAPALLPGTWRIRAGLAPGPEARSEVEVEAGREAHMELTLPIRIGGQ